MGDVDNDGATDFWRGWGPNFKYKATPEILTVLFRSDFEGKVTTELLRLMTRRVSADPAVVKVVPVLSCR